MKLIEWCNRVGVSLYWLGGMDWLVVTRSGDVPVVGDTDEAVRAFSVLVAQP